jgi:hypothetical protein
MSFHCFFGRWREDEEETVHLGVGNLNFTAWVLNEGPDYVGAGYTYVRICEHP